MDPHDGFYEVWPEAIFRQLQPPPIPGDRGPDIEPLELRNCHCGSTRGVFLSEARATESDFPPALLS